MQIKGFKYTIFGTHQRPKQPQDPGVKPVTRVCATQLNP